MCVSVCSDQRKVKHIIPEDRQKFKLFHRTGRYGDNATAKTVYLMWDLCE